MLFGTEESQRAAAGALLDLIQLRHEAGAEKLRTLGRDELAYLEASAWNEATR